MKFASDHVGVWCVALVCAMAGVSPCAFAGLQDQIDANHFRQRLYDTVDLFNGGANGSGGFGAYSSSQTVDPAWSGFMRPTMDRQFNYQSAWIDDNHIIGQARGVYINAVAAHALGTSNSRFEQAANKGAAFMTTAAWDNTHGGWYWGVNPNGTNPPTPVSRNVWGPKMQTKDAYGQVHPTLALATAYQSSNSAAQLNKAVQGWNQFKTKHNDAATGFAGGYDAGFSRDYSSHLADDRGIRNLDHMLHAFESAMSLWDVSTGSTKTTLATDAQNLGNHIVNTMVQNDPTSWNGSRFTRASVPWFYNTDWTTGNTVTHPQGGTQANHISPGHHFEFATFLSRGVERGLGNQTWLDAGEKLLEHGLHYSFKTFDTDADPDPDYAAVNFDALNLDSTNTGHDETVTWWPQLEAARALSHWAIVRNRADLWDQATLINDMVQDKLTDPAYDGMFANLDPANLSPTSGSLTGFKAHPWKVNYHAVMYFEEMVRLAELALAEITGDYNNSGQVEQGDLDLVLQNWGSHSLPRGWISDLPDGQIEQTELDKVLQNWGSTAAPNFASNFQAVPEPATLISALALTGLLLPRRRHS